MVDNAFINQLSNLVATSADRRALYGSPSQADNAYKHLEQNITNAFDGIDYTDINQVNNLKTYIDQEINNFTYRNKDQAFLTQGIKNDTDGIIKHFNTLNTDYKNDFANVNAAVNTVMNYADSGLGAYTDEFKQFVAETEARKIRDEGFEPVDEVLYQQGQAFVSGGFNPGEFDKLQNAFFLKNVTAAKEVIENFEKKYFYPDSMGPQQTSKGMTFRNRFFNQEMFPLDHASGSENEELLYRGKQTIDFLHNEYLSKRFEYETTYVDDLGKEFKVKTVLNKDEQELARMYFNGDFGTGADGWKKFQAGNIQMESNKVNQQFKLYQENTAHLDNYLENEAILDNFFKGGDLVDLANGEYIFLKDYKRVNPSDFIPVFKDGNWISSVVTYADGYGDLINHIYTDGEDIAVAASNKEDYFKILNSKSRPDESAKIRNNMHGYSITSGELTNQGFIEDKNKSTGEKIQVNFGDIISNLNNSKGAIKENSVKYLSLAPDADENGRPSQGRPMPMEKTYNKDGGALLIYPESLQGEIDAHYASSGYDWSSLTTNEAVQGLINSGMDVIIEDPRLEGQEAEFKAWQKDGVSVAEGREPSLSFDEEREYKREQVADELIYNVKLKELYEENQNIQNEIDALGSKETIVKQTILKTKSKKEYLKGIESNFNDNIMVKVDDFKKLENELNPNNELTADVLYGAGNNNIKSDKSGHDLTNKGTGFYVKAGYEAKNKQLAVLTDRAEILISALNKIKSKPDYSMDDNVDKFKSKSSKHFTDLATLEGELLLTISLIENLSSGQSRAIGYLQVGQPGWEEDSENPYDWFDADKKQWYTGNPLVKDYITTGKTVTTHDSRQDLYPKLEYIGEDLAKELKLDKNNTQSKGLFIID